MIRLKSSSVSDLLTAAAEALGTPAELVSRSAAARAAANGTTTDDVLSAWAGGAPAKTPAAPGAPDASKESAPSPETSPEPEETPAAAPTPPPSQVAAAVVVEVKEEAPLEPADIRDRIRTASRVGTWTGAVLGLFAFVIATSAWSKTASATAGDIPTPILITDASQLLIGVAIVSIVFGAVVASFARAAASWANPAMQLSASKSSTAWVGGILGLVLGIGGGAVLSSGFGTPIEGSEGLIQLPIMPTLLVMLIGGGVLGGLTTLVTQFFGVPVATHEDDRVEIARVKRRLAGAIGIPTAGLLILLFLVLPFAWTFIRSNHLTSGGAAIMAILAAAGVLGFASLAGTKPNMRISFGEFMVALAGIATIIILVFAVLNNTGGDEAHEEEAAPGDATIVLVNW